MSRKRRAASGEGTRPPREAEPARVGDTVKVIDTKGHCAFGVLIEDNGKVMRVRMGRDDTAHVKRVKVRENVTLWRKESGAS